jgi:hypothetical protein
MKKGFKGLGHIRLKLLLCQARNVKCYTKIRSLSRASRYRIKVVLIVAITYEKQVVESFVPLMVTAVVIDEFG